MYEQRYAVRMPKVLRGDKEAMDEWRRIVPELHRQGVMTMVDRALIAVYCASWGRWARAEEVVREKGEVVKTTNGNIIQNPYRGIANRAAEDLRKIGVEFGMTASSRSRIKVERNAELSLAEMLFQSVEETDDEQE
jgi:P27 family predicted phage terminase small subunit